MEDQASGTTLHHAGLPVADLERAVDWYRTALGLEHTTTARVPEGVEIAFVVDASGAGVELFALDAPPPPAWEGPIPALRAGTGRDMSRSPSRTWTAPSRMLSRRAVGSYGSRVPRRSPASGSRSSRIRTATWSS